MCEIQDIIHWIRTRNFVIYGTGSIGKRFYRQVQRIGSCGNVVAFAETNVDGEKIIDNKMVESIYMVSKDTLVFIAAHEANALEMKNILETYEYQQYIWIYPYLFELELGDPLASDIPIHVNRILVSLKNVYKPAICYLSLKKYCNSNMDAGKLYIKMLKYYTSLDTGRKRWERFCQKIEKCRQDGFFQDFNIKVDEKHRIIDGFHRLVLAKCFGVNILSCDVYHCDEYYMKNCDRVCEEELKKIFDAAEIESIKCADREMRSGIYD